MTFIPYIVISIFFLICTITNIHGYIYSIEKRLSPGESFPASEGYLFATDKGPPLMDKGTSFIEFSGTITLYSRGSDVEAGLFHLVFYQASDESRAGFRLPVICSEDVKEIKKLPYSDFIQLRTTPVSSSSSTSSSSNSSSLGWYSDAFLGIHNQSLYKHIVTFQKIFPIEAEGVFNTEIAFCEIAYKEEEQQQPEGPPWNHRQRHLLEQDRTPLHTTTTSSTSSSTSGLLVAHLEGSLIFRNPYGYLPGETYGMFPFEITRAALSFLALLWYLYLYHTHKETILPLHSALLVIFLLVTLESLFWALTYSQLNYYGDPYCCPYPPLVITSFLLQVIRQTCTRSLLLVVSLGYGIVRPRLLSTEWTAIMIVTFFYFLAALAEQINVIVLGNSRHSYSTTTTTTSSTTSSSSSTTSGVGEENSLLLVPEYVMDILFLSWIYFAISNTIRILTQFKQTAKLRIYENLISIIAIFVLLSACVSILYILDASQMIDWPWYLNWFQEAIWELLNISVLLATAIVTRPHENSRALQYSLQLPTDDDNDLEMTSHGFADHPGDDSSDEEEEGYNNGHDNDGEFEMVGYDRYSKNRKKPTLRRQRSDSPPIIRQTATKNPLRKENGGRKGGNSSSSSGGGGGRGSGGYDELPEGNDEEYGIINEE